MAAYATAKRTSWSDQVHLLPTRRSPASLRPVRPADGAALDAILVQLADLVAERLAARLAAAKPNDGEWLDTRDAAEYLGVHCDNIRRLAAERAVPSEQEGPGCKLFFRRSDLDAWRCSQRPPVRVIAGGQR